MLSEDELRDALLLVFANKQVGLCFLRLLGHWRLLHGKTGHCVLLRVAEANGSQAPPPEMPFARAKAAEALATARLDFQNGCRGIA
jgi:hypothetical protein